MAEVILQGYFQAGIAAVCDYVMFGTGLFGYGGIQWLVQCVAVEGGKGVRGLRRFLDLLDLLH